MLFLKLCVFYIMGLVLYKIFTLCSTKFAWNFSLSLSLKDYFFPARMDKLSFKHSFEGNIDPAFKKEIICMGIFQKSVGGDHR